MEYYNFKKKLDEKVHLKDKNDIKNRKS